MLDPERTRSPYNKKRGIAEAEVDVEDLENKSSENSGEKNSEPSHSNPDTESITEEERKLASKETSCAGSHEHPCRHFSNRSPSDLFVVYFVFCYINRIRIPVLLNKQCFCGE